MQHRNWVRAFCVVGLGNELVVFMVGQRSCRPYQMDITVEFVVFPIPLLVTLSVVYLRI